MMIHYMYKLLTLNFFPLIYLYVSYFPTVPDVLTPSLSYGLLYSVLIFCNYILQTLEHWRQEVEGIIERYQQCYYPSLLHSLLIKSLYPLLTHVLKSSANS